MTLAVVVATGVAAGRVRLAEYRRWRSAPVMARVPIGGRPMHGLECFVSDEMIYAGFWRFPRADIRAPGQRLTGEWRRSASSGIRRMSATAWARVAAPAA